MTNQFVWELRSAAGTKGSTHQFGRRKERGHLMADKDNPLSTKLKKQADQPAFSEALRTQYKTLPNDNRFKELLDRLEQTERDQDDHRRF